MNPEQPASAPQRPSLLRNWLSLTGLVIVIGSLFSFFLLFLLDVLAQGSNPYMGILTFVVAPAFLILGALLAGIGALRERRKLGQTAGGLLPKMVVDLSRPRDRKIMGGFIAASLVFLFLSALGSYKGLGLRLSVSPAAPAGPVRSRPARRRPCRTAQPRSRRPVSSRRSRRDRRAPPATRGESERKARRARLGPGGTRTRPVARAPRPERL